MEFAAIQEQPTRPQQQGTPTSSMQDSAPNAGDVGQAMKDKMFLRKAAQGGMAEVKLGQLAVQKGSSEDVKSFGQKMVDDHTKLNNDMAPIADSMGVRLPKDLSKDDQVEYDKLNALSGNDFDMEYLSFMVKDHHKDLREFRQEEASTTDPTLKTAVEGGAKVIHEHTVMVDKLAREKGVPMPQRGGNKAAPAPTL
jgi:putative membrane protein